VRTRTAAKRARIVQLAVVRARARLLTYQEAIGAALAANRRTLGRLHASGTLFSREGARAGRDLLLAHQHLLRVVALLQRLAAGAGQGGRGAPRRTARAYRELDRLLERASALTERTGVSLARIAWR